MNVFEKLSTKDIINHYSSNFNNLDEEKKVDLSNLIGEKIHNSSIIELVELYSDIELKSEMLVGKINQLQGEIVSKNKKIETYENLEHFARNQGLTRSQTLIKVVNKIEKKESKQKQLKLKLRMMSSFNIHIDSSIVEKINNLSNEERRTVKHQFTTKLEIIRDRINILNIEIVSEKERIHNFDSAKKLTKTQELGRLKSLIELCKKLYDNEFKKQQLETFTNIYFDKYCSILSLKTKTL